MDIDTVEISPEQAAELLSLEESHFLDLKGIDITPANLSRTASAFANASGGELYVGIDEPVGKNGRERVWRGFPNVEAANPFLQVIEGMSPLGNHYEAEFLRTRGEDGAVLHFTILKTREIVLASNGKAYIRRSAQKLPVEGDEALQRLKYDKGISSFEDELVDAESSEVTNSAVVIDFMLRVIPTAEPDAWLEKQRLILKGRPTPSREYATLGVS